MESGDPYFIELNNFIDLQGQKKAKLLLPYFQAEMFQVHLYQWP